MNKYFILLAFLFLSAISSYSQKNILRGQVKSAEANGKEKPLPFANVYWEGTTNGTSTDENGNFSIEKPKGSHHLVVNFIGYKNDTLHIENENKIEVSLMPVNLDLSTVEVHGRQPGSYISSVHTIKTENITIGGLQKLACCNLSESFENSATVDVGYSDAVSGAKQIQMLGLAGIYSQLMYENVPFMRGLASPFGLSYIPGTWMQSIQISKGTSSVINGFESMTGQINIEYKKPEHTTETVLVNLYGNDEGRAEANVAARIGVSGNVSTMLLAHASALGAQLDHNDDGYMDVPTSRQINVVNRWSIEHGHRGHTQLTMGVMNEDRMGGQLHYKDDPNWLANGKYGLEVKTRRYQGFLKSGYTLDSEGISSLGFQTSATYHNQESYFGKRSYNGTQKSLYGNAIFQSQIGSESHKYSAGISYQYDEYEENYNDSLMYRKESIPGIFGQYTLNLNDKFTAILGLRYDFTNLYRKFVTPRLHTKYNITEKLSLRGSAGKGYRTASVFAENIRLMASSRVFIISNDLQPEEAWNYGLNITQIITIDEDREATLTMDFYRTDFINQIVIDLDASAQKAIISNLDGVSWSNSFQAEATVDVLKKLTLTAAFRYNDVKITQRNELTEKAFVNKYKGLLTLSYATKFNKWSFDFTSQYNGQARLPDVSSNPEDYQRPANSNGYFIVHTQITRRFKNLEVYAGAENLTGYVQHHPIIAGDDPYGTYFDAGRVWGPLTGRMLYAGLRYTIL
ncbi:MAG: TonB-dependent receptor [Bacteroidales bacterium]|nr:TonB-dependent receptor [Bacteroidales bacterium]